MRQKKFYDPYAEVIDKFNRRNVRYVVIGMSGINYYASKTRETFSTQDFDIFLKPTINNIKASISVLKNLKYELTSCEQEVDRVPIKDIVKNKRTILAVNHYGITFELLLEISGFTFHEIERDAVIFDVGGVPIKVARLTKILASKKIAGRKKDKLFLKRFESLLKEKSREIETRA